MQNHPFGFLSTLFLTFAFSCCVVLSAQELQLDFPSTNQETPNLQSNQISTQPSLHVLRLCAEGMLIGLIDAPSLSGGSSLNDNGCQLYLINGRDIQHSTTTDGSGKFSLAQVTPGPYSMVVCGADGFAAHGVYVAPSSSRLFVNGLRPGFVSPQVPGFRTVLKENLPRAVAAKILGSHDPSFDDVSVAFNRSDSGASSQLRQVQLDQGQLRGRIGNMFGQAQDMRGIMVSIVQNGKRVAEAKVDDRGLFAVPNMQPGVYEFVAVGRQGFAAVRFNAVGDSVPIIDGSFQSPIGPITSSLDVCLTCRIAGVAVSPPSQTVPSKPKPSVLQSSINTSDNWIDYGGYVAAHSNDFDFVGP